MTEIAIDKRIPAKMLSIPEDGKTYGIKDGKPEEIIIGGLAQTQGEWTPILVALGSNPTLTYLAQNGYWVKTGVLIHFRIQLQWSAVSGGSGGLRITLPAEFTGDDNAPGTGASINRVSGISFSGQVVFSVGTTHININQMNTDGSFETVDVDDLSASGSIYISGFYTTSSEPIV